MDALVGMQGFSVYYHTLPKNKVNDWLVEEHKNVLMVQCQICLQREECQRISIVEALKKTKGDTDVDTLIKKMEGMEFDTPKGKMKFREKDHQAMQTLYSITLKSKMVLIIRCQC